jgi:hypothetical protein
MKYRPITQTVRDRISLLLIESINTVDIEHIDLYVEDTTERLLELFIEELKYNASRLS